MINQNDLDDNGDSAEILGAVPSARMACNRSGAAIRGRVLLVAYHFPPDAASTGRLRTLGFMRHLPESGWLPTVLTTHKRAYEQLDETGLVDVPNSGSVRRAFALDTRRHLGWQGKYLSLCATPDRWVTWWPDAVRLGLGMIRRQKIDAIWSTYPIMTSHLIALSLQRLTGLPWIADFRDPVVSKGSGFTKRVNRWLEQRVAMRSTHLVFTTPSAKQLYTDRFRNLVTADKFDVISNGYEEERFSSIETPSKKRGTRCTMVHSGLLYREGRNPLAFFQALARLKKQSVVDSSNFRVVLRASGHEEEYNAELVRLGLTELVELAAPVSYRIALQEQASADGLLLFQGQQFNAQIPAKVYDYLRLGLPIVALTHDAGDTAQLLRGIDGAQCVAMDDIEAIATVLTSFVERWRDNDLTLISPQVVRNYSRRAGAERLAAVLSHAVHGGQG